MTTRSIVRRALSATAATLVVGAGVLAFAGAAQAAPAAVAPAPAGVGEDTCAAQVLDVAILIDTTGSMSGAIEAAQRTAVEAAQKVVEAGGKVALVEYRDIGDTPEVRTATDFTDVPAEFQAATNELRADGGNDTPEAALHAINWALDGLDWRANSARSVILITDAPYHDPDQITPAQTTASTVAALTAANTQLFPILTYSELRSNYETLVNGAGGSITTLEGAGASVDEIIKQVIDDVVSRPWVRFVPETFSAGTGESVALPTESGAECKPLEVASWSWEFVDGDPDASGTTTGSASAVYATPGTYTVKVTLTTLDGQTATSTTTVTITAPVTPTPTDTPTDTPTPTGTSTPTASTSIPPTAPGSTPSDPALANTGADGEGALIAAGLAGAALLAGAVLLLARRRSA